MTGLLFCGLVVVTYVVLRVRHHLNLIDEIVRDI